MVVEQKHSYRIKKNKKARFISKKNLSFSLSKKSPPSGIRTPDPFEDTPLTSPQACTRDQKKHIKKSVVRSPTQQQLI